MYGNERSQTVKEELLVHKIDYIAVLSAPTRGSVHRMSAPVRVHRETRSKVTDLTDGARAHSKTQI